MKLIWYSTAPFVGVGYGVLTRALVKRMIADGHFIKIATKHHIGGQMIVEGVEVFDGNELGLINVIGETENYDYIISCMDTWVLANREPFKNWVAVNLIDTEFMYQDMIKALRKSMYQSGVTKHGVRELERTGFKPFYTPLGVDTKLFKPDHNLRKVQREKRGWSDETFVIGLVGINYVTDRKNIVGTIRAFQGFHKRHPDSVLFLHTDVMGSATQGHPLGWVMNSCGFEDSTGGREGAIQYIDQKRYHLWDIAQEELALEYNAFDIFCLPSQGEGFGLPWLEAQACGCPIINVDTTSGKELNFGGWLIPALEDYFVFSTLLTWYVKAPPSAIDERLEEAYQEWKSGAIKKRQKKARRGALKYEWDVVYAKYWRPMLQALERRDVTIDDVPNYGTGFYESFQGRILMIDCKKVCGKPEICDIEYPLLPGEWGGPRAILSRSYPIIPNKEGNLLACIACPLHKWMSPRFVSECEKAWEQLCAYPLIRKAIAELWSKGHFDKYEPYIPVDQIEHHFDESYREAMQVHYWTTFELTDEVLALIPKGGKVLDVGTGDGKRVRTLREKGFDALGTEINKVWIDDDVVVYGDAEDLPFEDNSFDVVMAIDTLEHLEHPHKAISELLRVTHGKALLQITPTEDRTYYEDPTHKVPWSLEQWKRELAEYANIMKTFQGCGFVLEKKGAPKQDAV